MVPGCFYVAVLVFINGCKAVFSNGNWEVVHLLMRQHDYNHVFFFVCVFLLTLLNQFNYLLICYIMVIML